MSFDFTVSDVIPASPKQIYDAWLDTEGHSAMTGGEAHTTSEVGGAFDAWGGFISGANLELDPGRRIVQSWRTTKFAESDEDSQIEVALEPVEGATRVTIHHTNVPDGHESYRDGGWGNNYFEPMKAYFGGSG